MLYSYLRCYCNFHQDNRDKRLTAAEFAYNSAVTEDLGMSPIERDLGWNQKSPLELISGARGEEVNASAEDFSRKLKVSLEDAYFLHKVAKAKQRGEMGSILKYRVTLYDMRPGNNLRRIHMHSQTPRRSGRLNALSRSEFYSSLGGMQFVSIFHHIRRYICRSCVSYKGLYSTQISDIGKTLTNRSDPIASVVEMEYEVKKILK